VSMNPLLDFSGLPRFADIRPEHVAPAIDQLLSENQALIDRLGADAQSPTWENFVAPSSLSGNGPKATLNLTDAMVGPDGLITVDCAFCSTSFPITLEEVS